MDLSDGYEFLQGRTYVVQLSYTILTLQGDPNQNGQGSNTPKTVPSSGTNVAGDLLSSDPIVIQPTENSVKPWLRQHDNFLQSKASSIFHLQYVSVSCTSPQVTSNNNAVLNELTAVNATIANYININCSESTYRDFFGVHNTTR